MLGTVRGFQLQKFLGKGTFGAVYMAKREKDGKMYAIKKVDTKKMNDSDRAEAVNEIRILASIAGNHTITFYEAFVHQDMLYIVTDFASHGDLQKLYDSGKVRGPANFEYKAREGKSVMLLYESYIAWGFRIV